MAKAATDLQGKKLTRTKCDLFPVGEYPIRDPFAPVQGVQVIDDESVAHIIQNFKTEPEATRRKIPVTLDHQGGEAVGWIDGVGFDGDRSVICGDVEWTPRGLNLIENKAYAFTSPEFEVRSAKELGKDDDGNSKWGIRKMTGFSLTNHPNIPDQKPLVNSKDEKEEVKRENIRSTFNAITYGLEFNGTIKNSMKTEETAQSNDGSELAALLRELVGAEQGEDLVSKAKAFLANRKATAEGGSTEAKEETKTATDDAETETLRNSLNDARKLANAQKEKMAEIEKELLTLREKNAERELAEYNGRVLNTKDNKELTNLYLKNREQVLTILNQSKAPEDKKSTPEGRIHNSDKVYPENIANSNKKKQDERAKRYEERVAQLIEQGVEKKTAESQAFDEINEKPAGF